MSITQPKLTTRQKNLIRRCSLVLLVIALVTIGWRLSTQSSPTTVTPVAATPEAVTTRDAGTTAEATILNPPRPDRDVSWRIFAGIDLPISATAGPYRLTKTRATGFAHTEAGAALAAAQLLVRSFPFAGSDTFEPTIAEQVTGRGAAALARLTRQAYRQTADEAGVHDGAPIRSVDGWVTGYRVHDDGTDQTTRVDVLINGTGEDYGFVSYAVQLTWQNNDWRLIAPAWGDWRSNAHPVPHPYPASYRDYDNIGIGPGGAS